MGYVSGLYGISGWVRVFSYSDPRERIADYSPWQLRGGPGDVRLYPVTDGRRQGKSVVAKLAGVADRGAAATLIGKQIYVDRRQFEEAGEGEYYWVDLIGLAVRTEQGEPLGTVDSLMATGANDVLVVAGDRRRLIPFIRGDVVKSIDDERIIVDWHPDD